MLDCRVGTRRESKDLPIKAKKSSSIYLLPNLVRKTSAQVTLVKEAVVIGSDEKIDDKQSQAEQDLPYVFTPNKMPTQKQLFYQLCDLHDSEIQRLVSINDGQVCLAGDLKPGSHLCDKHKHKHRRKHKNNRVGTGMK